MKLSFLLASCIIFILVAGGCSWVGQTAGKTQAKIERKTNDLEQGYHKGYREEKSKTEGGQNAADAPNDAKTQ